MIKKEKKKKQTLVRNPYLYYVTNWGFVGDQTKPNPRSVNNKS